MNYLISYKTHDFVSPRIAFQVIKSESKIDAVKHLLDNHQEAIDIIAISEMDDALTEVIKRKYYDSEAKPQSSTIAQKIDEAIKAPQKPLSENEAKRTLQDLGILDEQGNITAAYENIVDRKLEDYTLKEVKQLCRQQLDCPDCPFYNERFDYCLLMDKIPEKWEV